MRTVSAEAEVAARTSGAKLGGAFGPHDHPEAEAGPAKERYSVLFKSVSFPSSKSADDTTNEAISSSDAASAKLRRAENMAQKAQRYYGTAPQLFPPDDLFYEEVEQMFILKVIDDDRPDGFVGTLHAMRCITNDNTRTLYCELAPTALMVALSLLGAFMFLDPLRLLDASASSWQSYLQPTGLGIGLAIGAWALGLVLVLFIYSFSYKHVQKENGLRLNGFISNEFARSNESFRVAQTVCERIEGSFDMNQEGDQEELERQAAVWALSYHWIGVLQLQQEMTVRNTMFQIRRNATLYRILGILICIVMTIVAVAAVYGLARVFAPATEVVALASYLLCVGAAFIIAAYGVAMNNPFAVFEDKDTLRTDEWRRFHSLKIDEAVGSQISRDKANFAILRDRRR